MRTYNLCLVGFGYVGQALVHLLRAKSDELRERYGIGWRVTGVGTRRLGWLADAEGLDLDALLAGVPPARPPATLPNMAAWLTAAQADVLFELSSLDPHSGQPAIEYIRTALAAGVHAVTANKGAVLHGYHALSALAAATGVRFRHEAAFMGGTPIYSLFRETLPATRLQRFSGLLNSTTSVILETLESGGSFDDAVRDAQRLGIAETDPSADIDGWDAAVKLAALATVLMDTALPLDAVEREGIRHLDGAAVRAARAAGRPYRLVARAERTQDGVRASVRPEQLPPDDPLAGIRGTTLAAHFEIDLLPGLTLISHSPGPDTTAYDAMADFVNIVREEAGTAETQRTQSRAASD